MRMGIHWKLNVCLAVLVLLPASASAQNPSRDVDRIAQAIDVEILKTLKTEGVAPAPLADDAEFLRRVSIDIIGRIPSADKAADFLRDTDSDRRRKLIDELLAHAGYGEHFAGIWTDLIRATGTPPQSMTASFRKWLSEEFNQNRSWDKIAHDLLTAEGLAPASFFVRANYMEPGKVSSTAARFFLGVRLECAECHDHPFLNWKQTDYWGMAAFFGRVKQISAKGGKLLSEESIPGKKKNTTGASIVIPGSGVRDGAGKVVMARFLNGPEPRLPDEGPLRPTLADWIVARENPYFAQAAVNRIWSHLFGRGFVNPIDDLHEDMEPSHPELLNLLAREFSESGHDLKHLIRCIANSQTYQRTSKPVAGNKNDAALFSHMAVKVMTANVLFDSLVTALGEPRLPGGLGAPLPYEVYAGGNSKTSKPNARDEFIKFFDTSDDSGRTTEYTHGIPQILALMNAGQFNAAPPIVDRLVKANLPRGQAIETLFLATLTRLPTDNEINLMTGYLQRRQDLTTGYTGVLWILFNTNEFVLNH